MTDTTEIQRRDFLATAATTPLVVWDDDEEDDCGLIDQILNRCEPGVDPDSITIEMGPERPDSPDDPQVFVQTDTEGGDPQVIWTFNDGNWSVAGGRGTEENPVPEQHVREQHSDVLHTESLNNTIYASENDSSLPSIQTALDGASDGDRVVIAPGWHGISSTVTVDSQITLIFQGGIEKESDVVALETNADCHLVSNRAHNQADIRSSVSDTTAGAVYHNRTEFSGLVTVRNVGSHGHYFHQETSGEDNCNTSAGYIRSLYCTGDGVRFENDTGDIPDLNAMQLVVVNSFGNEGDGINLVDGWYNRILATVEANDTTDAAGIRIQDNDNYFGLPDSEANDTGVIFESGTTRNFVTGKILDGYDNRGSGTNICETELFQNKLPVTNDPDTSQMGRKEMRLDAINDRLVVKDNADNAYEIPMTEL